MANTRVQHKVEQWIVESDLSQRYGVFLSKRRVQLTWGGVFEFDAVSADGRVVISVSTSICRTASGRNAIGKYLKIKADALYLLNAVGAERRALVFTDPGMVAHFERERSRGRFPPGTEIDLVLVNLPADLVAELCEARSIASREVTPHTELD